MKKILFIFAMLITAVGMQAKTDKLYASAGDKASNATWDADTNTFGWTGSSSNQMKIFTFEAGTLSKYKKLVLDIQDITKSEGATGSKGGYRIFIGNGNANSNDDINLETTGSSVEFTISKIAGLTSDEIESATWIKISGTNSSGSTYWNKATCTLTLANCYLETAEYENMEVTTTINNSSDKDTPFAWTATGTLTTITNNLGKDDNAVIFGYAINNGLARGAFDVTGYDKVKWTLSEFDGTKSTALRLLAGEGTEMSQTVSSGTYVYEQALTLTKCTSVKAGSGASTCQKVSTIDFIKNFKTNSASAFSIAASVLSTVNYDRSFTANQKSTVCLPFALTQDECNAAGKFYELTDYDGTTLTFTQVTTGGTTAYKPYLFMAKENGSPFSSYSDKAIVASSGATLSYTTTANGGYTATMTGTLAHQTVNGKYGWNATSGEFSKATSDAVTINAFRAYITVSGGAGARSLGVVFDDEGTTVITDVRSKMEELSGVYYDLSGRRVENPTKGLYIKNGKKIFIR